MASQLNFESKSVSLVNQIKKAKVESKKKHILLKILLKLFFNHN